MPRACVAGNLKRKVMVQELSALDASLMPEYFRKTVHGKKHAAGRFVCPGVSRVHTA